MSSLYLYVVARDFGFAPNPFHGVCTLATCKQRLRSTAREGDWVVGVGGGRLKATGKCVFGMQVTRKLTFNQYWESPEFQIKKPVRNGSRVMMVGDNIYHRSPSSLEWQQADSHHSNADGSANIENLRKDTWADAVLVSERFFYFGVAAPVIPQECLEVLNYKNCLDHRIFNPAVEGAPLIDWLLNSHAKSLNQVVADPFDFDHSGDRWSETVHRIVS